MSRPFTSPKHFLIAGVEILNASLSVHGFAFEFRGGGRGAGGYFAWGEFLRDNRRLELHYRQSLGLVTYHVMDAKATHENYMRELGVWGRNRYPGFSSEHLQDFRDLLHDLAFAEDFVSGDAHVLLSAANKQEVSVTARSKELMAGYVGDTDRLEEMRALFQARRYADVVAIFGSLKFPDRLSSAQLRMVQLSRERSGASLKKHLPSN